LSCSRSVSRPETRPSAVRDRAEGEGLDHGIFDGRCRIRELRRAMFCRSDGRSSRASPVLL
jgi:hypothetical protein